MKCVFDVSGLVADEAHLVKDPVAWWKCCTGATLRRLGLSADMHSEADRSEFVDHCLKGMKFKAKILQGVSAFEGRTHAQLLDVVSMLCGFDSWYDASQRGKALSAPVDLTIKQKRKEAMSSSLQLSIGAWGLAEQELHSQWLREGAIDRITSSLIEDYKLSQEQAQDLTKKLFVISAAELQRLNSAAAVEQGRREFASQLTRKEEAAELVASVRRAYETGDSRAFYAAIWDTEHINFSQVETVALVDLLEGWIGERKFSEVGHALAHLQKGMTGRKYTLAQCYADSAHSPPDRTALESAVMLASGEVPGFDNLESMRFAMKLAEKVGVRESEQIELNWLLAHHLLENADGVGGEAMEAFRLWVGVYEFQTSHDRSVFDFGFYSEGIGLQDTISPVIDRQGYIDTEVFGNILRLCSKAQRGEVHDEMHRLGLKSSDQSTPRTTDDAEDLEALQAVDGALEAQSAVMRMILVNERTFMDAEWEDGKLRLNDGSHWRYLADCLCYLSHEKGKVLLAMLADE